MGRGRKGQAAFLPLVLSCGSEDVGENWNGKTLLAYRRSVYARGGLERKVFLTSAGAWGLLVNFYLMKYNPDYRSLDSSSVLDFE